MGSEPQRYAAATRKNARTVKGWKVDGANSSSERESIKLRRHRTEEEVGVRK
jgi:hypothetical protein